jgi:2-keto-4-pentenoate hydratase/2-oxohepta-3-ene-1,7-dioic acid hydratase in catechol pathway
VAEAMRAVRYVGDGGEPRIGRLDGDAVVDAGPAGPRGFEPTRAAWDALAHADGARRPLTDVRLLTPVAPGKIIGIGLNYLDHAGGRAPAEPVVFGVFPSALIASGEPIVVPPSEPKPDWEGEVAIVIGARARDVGRADAAAVVGGVTAANDVSGRRTQLETPTRQYTLGKSFDTFKPLGPCIADAAALDLAAIGFETRVSGERKQVGNTADLIYPVGELIEYLSAVATLEPGDVILTGTPAGVGLEHEPPRWLRDGDVVEVSVDGVGTLVNPVTVRS